jgi:hypothetical protein
MNPLAFALRTANDCLETLWQQAREAKGPRTRFFEHIRTISAYFVFPSWCSLMNTLISCNAPPNENCRLTSQTIDSIVFSVLMNLDAPLERR